MYKKIIYLFIALILSSGFANSQTVVRGPQIPEYLKYDYGIDNPELLKLPLFQRVRYAEVPPEILKLKPKKTKILTESGITLVNISPGNNAQTETWIAINPTDPENIIATSNDNYYLGGRDNWRMSSWWSKDGGLTWTHSPTPPNQGTFYEYISSEGGNTIFDPGVCFDSEGIAYYSYGFTQTNLPETKNDDNGVFVVRSTDGGEDWSIGWDEIPINYIAVEFGQTIQPFHDRYTITCDLSDDSPYKDNLYITWKRFDKNANTQTVGGAIVFSRSTDGGATWTNPATEISGSGGTQAPMPITGPDGEIYVVYRSSANEQQTEASVIKSTNGGTIWSAIQKPILTYNIGTYHPDLGRWRLDSKQGIRISNVPQIAVDNSDGPYRGNAYVVMPGRETFNGPYGIFFSKLEAGETEWTPQKRIDENSLNNDMFFPSIACDPITGIIAIFYYSSQNDPDNHGVDGYLAISSDGGETFKNIRVTNETIYLNNKTDVFPQSGEGHYYWGDYTSIAAYNGKIYPLFWLPSDPSGHFGTNDLFTALISNGPQPPTNFASESIFTGDEVSVKLTWQNPTETILGEELTDYTLHIFRDDKGKLTELPAGSTEYTDSDVISGAAYVYSIKAVSASGESPTIDVSLTAGGAREPKAPKDLAVVPQANGMKITWTNPSQAVDGTDLKDLHKINIYVNNELIEYVEGATISAGEASEYVLTLAEEKLNQYHKVQISAVGFRGDVETESVKTNEFLGYAGASLSELSENFDGTLTPHYTEEEWGITDEVAKSSPNCFVTAPGSRYDGNITYKLLFAPVTVTEENSVLNFENIATIKNDDYGILSVSNDYGKTWNDILWINEDSFDEFTSDPSTSEWLYRGYDMTDYIGDDIIVRFQLVSSHLLASWGWYLDDIKLDGSAVSVEDQHIYNTIKTKVFPNPAQASANLTVDLPSNAVATIEVYDQIGNKVKTITNKYYDMGRYEFPLEIDNLANGVYFIRVTTNGISKTSPFVIAK